MAYGIALLFRMDQFDEITEGIESRINSDKTYNPGAGSYYVDMNGNLKMQGGDSFTGMQEFNPERDLDEDEYQKYLDSYNRKLIPPEINNHEIPQIDKDILNLIKGEITNMN